MRPVLLLFLMGFFFVSLGQSYEASVESALVNQDLKTLQKLRKKQPAHPGWTDCSFFKKAAEADFQEGMKWMFGEALVCDPVWLNDLVLSFWQNRRKDEVLYWGEPLLNEVRQSVGEQHSEYAFGANTLGVSYYQVKDWEKAERYQRQAYEVFKMTRGANHPDTENARQNLINVYDATNQKARTEDLLKEAVDYAARTYGFDSAERLKAQRRVMDLYTFLNRPKDAADASFIRLLIAEQLYADNPGELAHALADYLKLSNEAGSYLDLVAKAEETYLPLAEKAWGKASVNYADALMLVGTLHESREEYSKAEECYLQALPQISRYTDVQHVLTLIRLFRLYDNLGRPAKKEQYIERLLSLLEKFKDKSAEDRAGATMTVAALLIKQGKTTEAKELLEEAMKESNYRGLVLQMGIASYADGHYETALRHFHAYGKMGRASGREHTYDHLVNLAGCHQHLLHFDSALHYIELAREAYFKQNGFMGATLYNLGTHEARALWATGDRKVALNKLGFDNYFRLRKINREFFSMSEVERKQFWEENQAHFQLYQRLAPEDVAERPERAGDLYDVQLQTKGLLLNTTDLIHRLIAKSEDSVLRRDYARWTDLRLDWARYSSYPAEQLQADSIDLKALESEINALEKSLAERSSAFAQAYQVPTWQQVRDRLKPGEAAIEIVRTRDADSSVYLTKKPYYFALVVKPESEWPEVVVFPHPETMEESGLQYYRNAIRFKLNDTRSYDLYWRPLEPALKGVKRIYLSADGVYNLINPNTLKNAETSHFLMDDYEILSVTNTRELLEEPRASTRKRTAVVAGFPAYDVQAEAYARFANELPQMTTRGAYANASEWLSGEAVVELPGTRSEVDNLSRSFRQAGWKVIAYTGVQATEEAIRAVDNPTVLHVATHGFFIDASGEEEDSADPMLRSGLLLAGVTNFAQADPKPSTEDGILTAYEATSLRLEETELVVLSACETGLGEVQNGEGVYGLQRALRVAGARSVLMSLWKVDDQATQALMTGFYRHWLGGMPRLEAFRRAQADVRAQFPEPYYWGAFQLLGTD